MKKENVKERIIELCHIDVSVYKCISQSIDTSQVIITEKQLEHIASHHPEAYKEILIELKSTLLSPDYIIKDDRHDNTGIVIKAIKTQSKQYSYVVLKVCTDSANGELANSVISGWKISMRRLNNYLTNKVILYKKE